MQEVTINKLQKSLDLITDYLAENIGLKYLIDALDGILLSMEEPLPKHFLSIWQDTSFNLESIYALGKEENLKDEVRKEINVLEVLISNFIMNQKEPPAD